ncbi:Serine/threonine-protein kinase [Choiromyces venosus 120613-1]|uniref:non-specific serine/threonine protein kinase n=1 Tax=Choiromyces venosus 120613-1 TaxID=1336337 RepID=A0A3N4K530_9PEZI|nr:Serine/threonine-protein kinase [Choiromyces venosus 120613-1]
MPATNKVSRTAQNHKQSNPNGTGKAPHQNGGPKLPTTAPGKKPKRGSISTPKQPAMTPAPPPLDHIKVQEDEIEVLKSIFMDDYEMVETAGAWNKSNLAFKIRLKASSDEEISCVLHVTFTATYPKTAPELRLVPSSAIRPAQEEILQSLLSQSLQNNLGQEMIFDITSTIQDALEDIVQSKLADQDKPSLDEERALKAMEAQLLAKREWEEARRRKERMEMEAQRKLQEEIDEEIRRQKANVKQSHEKRRAPSIDYDDVVTDDCVLFDRVISIKRGYNATPVMFRKVSGMVKISTGPLMSVYTVHPVLAPDQENDLPLVLKQVDVPDVLNTKGMDGKKKVQNLELVLDELRRLRHNNVVEIYGSKVSRIDSLLNVSYRNSSGSTGGWRISILMEYSNKGSLHDLLETVGQLNVDMVRAWTISLIEGLDHIHRMGTVHRGIHAGNVLLFRDSSGGSTIPKLTDMGYTPALWEIIDNENGHPEASTMASAKSVSWFPPENTNQVGVKPNNRKTDIWNLGIVILQMLFGLKVVEKYSSPSALIHDTPYLSDSLRDFLERIFKSDPKKRPTTFDLLPSEFLRSSDPILGPSTPSPELSKADWSVSNKGNYNRPRRDSAIMGNSSRYANDFLEIGRLGKGGFGEVVKARNKLDGNTYAIKKITKIGRSKLNNILHEVMLLSRLNHKYVIRYYTAWLEEEDPDTQPFSESSGGENDDYDSDEDSDDSGPAVFSGSSTGAEDEGEVDDRNKENGSDDGIEFTNGTGGLDFISGGGYSDVSFEDDSDEPDESEDEEEKEEGKEEGVLKAMRNRDEKSRPPIFRRSSNGKSSRSTLYIQMSLADQLTLRDKVLSGLDADEAWRLLRQILEGLAHIHGLGIIHRDLKPENIFIDLNGNPQIGDFGLATSGQVSNKTDQSGSDDIDLTTNVGTVLYVAPELRTTKGHGKYDGRADMYSLGIIFFEMCYIPLVTVMERGKVIGKLREKEVNFPTDFATDKNAIQISIIKSLLSHDPAERPSSTDLLNSGKLPLKVEDETIRQALRSISDPGTPHHQQVMSALFSQSTKEYKDHTYDPTRSILSRHDMILQGMVKERLTEIFRHHGAVETTRSLLLPRSKFYNRDVVQLLDQNGTVVQLPYDLTLPHARSLARQETLSPKTFTFGTVYRENPAGGQPRSHGEVDFDIISYNSYDLALKEAEAIKVIDEILDAFPSLRSNQMCFHINHADLLDIIMEFCRINSVHRPVAKEILSKLNTGQWLWPRIRNELITSGLGILPTSLDDLAKFDWRDEQEKAFSKLKLLLHGSTLVDKANTVFAHIRAVIGYLKQFGVTRNIYVNPLGTWNDKFYRGGVVFQCIVDSKKKDVFAAGGRYDSLIQSHRPAVRGIAEETHAVGFNLGWEKLFTSVARFQKNYAKHQHKKNEDENVGPWVTRRYDVLVASFCKTALRTHGITILRELWANGISAELAGDASSPEQLINGYKGDGISWIIIIKQGSSSSLSGDRCLKVKSLFRKEDVELKAADMVPYLKNEIIEREKRERSSTLPGTAGALAGMKSLTRHPSSTGEILGRQAGDDGEARVRILASDRKGRKISKGSIISAAQRASSELLTSFHHSAPIAAIDVRDDILDAIKHTGLHDQEAWRKIIQGAPAVDRKYISLVQDLLVDLKENSRTSGCLVFNYRSGGIIFYYLT